MQIKISHFDYYQQQEVKKIELINDQQVQISLLT